MTLTELVELACLPPLVRDVIAVSIAVEVVARLVLRWPRWREIWQRRQGRAEQAKRSREHRRQRDDHRDSR